MTTVTLSLQDYENLKQKIEELENDLQEIQDGMISIKINNVAIYSGASILGYERSLVYKTKDEVIIDMKKSIDQMNYQNYKESLEQVQKINDLRIEIITLRQTSLFERIFRWGQQ